tara:strand:+ start:17244 stop:19742 length:2499 start_codon:yes stop_codon:yes gene_type:complete
MFEKYRKLWVFTIFSTLLCGGGALVVMSCLYLYLSPKLPSVEELKEIELQIPLRIYSQDLKVMAEFGEKKRNPVSFDQIPNAMVDAFLAAEDSSFFEHGGIAISGLVRAALELARTGSIRSGGSTITMQVARNFFLTKRQEFTRKFNEILLALRIEDELTKQQILSLYANKIYMGNRAYGVGAAAQVYYGKTLEQLSLAEIAMIAGLPKAPSRYNPLANSERAMQRRDWILGRMLTLGNIDQLEYQNAISEPDNASYHGSISQRGAAYAAELVRQQVIEKFGLKAYTKGYTVITSIDSQMQHQAVAAVQSGILTYDKRHGYRGAERSSVDPEKWLEILQKTPTFAGLEAMIVSEVEDQYAILVDRNDRLHTLEWADGIEGTRLYKTVNSLSSPITSAQTLLTRGDLIRVTRDDTGRLQLAQLPDAQAAMVAIAPRDGAIRALVGGFDYTQSNFNRVTQATRQPGSNFKPFLYAIALRSGFTAATLFNDAPVVFNDSKLEDTWRPENDGGKFYGPTRLRVGLYRSRNLVSIRLLRRLGIDRALEGLQDFGFDTGEMPLDLSLALGSHALTPLQIASGYAVFANGGYRVKPYILDKIIDRKGNIVYQAEALCADCAIAVGSSPANGADSLDVDVELEDLFDQLAREKLSASDRKSQQIIKLALQKNQPKTLKPATQVLDSRSAFLIDSILKDVILRGTGVKAKALERSDLGGKTGTTNGPRDAWFSGYSSDLAVTAWVGFDDNSIIGRNEYGGSAALPIWIDFMGAALDGRPEVEHPQPNGIVRVKIDAETGERIDPEEQGVFEYFKSENVPELQRNTSTLPNGEQSPLPDDLL